MLLLKSQVYIFTVLVLFIQCLRPALYRLIVNDVLTRISLFIVNAGSAQNSGWRSHDKEKC